MGMSPMVRTVLFWVLMIALAIVLWQMSSKPANDKNVSQMTYSDFMNQVDKNNVGSVELFDRKETAEIDGQLCQPAQKFKVTIPKEVIPDLTERLRKQGVVIGVSSSPESNWLTLVLNLAPLILIIGIWIFMMKQMRTRRDQSTSGDPSNRPIQ